MSRTAAKRLVVQALSAPIPPSAHLPQSGSKLCTQIPKISLPDSKPGGSFNSHLGKFASSAKLKEYHLEDWSKPQRDSAGNYLNQLNLLNLNQSNQLNVDNLNGGDSFVATPAASASASASVGNQTKPKSKGKSKGQSSAKRTSVDGLVKEKSKEQEEVENEKEDNEVENQERKFSQSQNQAAVAAGKLQVEKPIMVDVFCSLEGFFDLIRRLLDPVLEKQFSFTQYPVLRESIPKNPRAKWAILTVFCPTDRWKENISQAIADALSGAYHHHVCLILLKPIQNPSNLVHIGPASQFSIVKQICVSDQEVYDIAYNRQMLGELMSTLTSCEP